MDRTADPTDAELQAEILRQVSVRGDEKSICPSEVARTYGTHWPSLMSRVREAAKVLSRGGQIDILRKGKPVEPEAVKGVIRLRRRPEALSAPKSGPE